MSKVDRCSGRAYFAPRSSVRTELGDRGDRVIDRIMNALQQRDAWAARHQPAVQAAARAVVLYLDDAMLARHFPHQPAYAARIGDRKRAMVAALQVVDAFAPGSVLRPLQTPDRIAHALADR